MDAKLNIVPVCDHNELEVAGLYESLESVIERYVERQGATVAEIVGILECLKHEVLTGYE